MNDKEPCFDATCNLPKDHADGHAWVYGRMRIAMADGSAIDWEGQLTYDPRNPTDRRTPGKE